MQNRNTRIAVVSIFSIAMGLLYLFPHILFIRELGGEYWGFVLLGSPDKEFYLSLVREVLDGHWLLASPFLFEHKDVGLSAFPFVGVWIAALPGLVGLSIGSITIFWDFVAPASATTLCYWVYRRAGLSYWTAIAAAVTVMASPYLLALEPAAVAMIEKHPRSHGFYFFLPMMRTINPQQSALVFLVAWGAWVGMIRRGSPLWLPVESGRPQGVAPTIIAVIPAFLLSLTNLYFATFLITLTGIWGLASFFSEQKSMGLRHLAVTIGGVLGLAVIAVNLLSLKHKLGELHSVNVVRSHWPMLGSGGVMLVVLSVLTYLVNRYRRGAVTPQRDIPTKLSAAISIAYVICMNQQVITGVMLQAWHYELYVAQFLLPLNFFIFIDTAGKWLNDVAGQKMKFRKYGTYLLAAWMMMCVADGVAEQAWGYSQMHRPYAMASKIYREPFRWLNENAPRDAVVLADPLNTARFIPMYTSLNVLASLGASEFPIPSPSEMRDRLMWSFAAMGMPPWEFKAYAIPDDAPFHFAFFSRRRSNPSTGRGHTEWRLPPLTQAELQSVAIDYERVYNAYDLAKMPYRLDYCLRGFYEARAYYNPWKVQQYCSPAASSGQWTICRVYHEL